MTSLVIVAPMQPAAVIYGATAAGWDRALTPNPKEAAVAPPGGGGLSIDMGKVVTIDSAFLGYHTAQDGQGWAVVATDANGSPVGGSMFGVQPLNAFGAKLPAHAFQRGTLTSRYFQVQTNGGPSNIGFNFGVIALGVAFQPTWGHEFGGGRRIIDTGSKDRLLSGAFGVNPGVRATGWSFTMGDLTDVELEALFEIIKAVGETSTVLVVENPDQTTGISNRCHWGMFSGLDYYERLVPGASRWAFKIEDWA